MNPLNMPKRRTALKVKTPHPREWRNTAAALLDPGDTVLMDNATWTTVKKEGATVTLHCPSSGKTVRVPETKRVKVLL